MQQNLKTTSYNDGTAIPLVTDLNIWYILGTPGYCWYNDSIQYKNLYGALYNWYTVNTGKLCPTGWHIPTYIEWDTLMNYLGGLNIAGGALKSTTGWNSPNIGATNSSGFTALPGGIIDQNDGGFGEKGIVGFWWAAQYYPSLGVPIVL